MTCGVFIALSRRLGTILSVAGFEWLTSMVNKTRKMKLQTASKSPASDRPINYLKRACCTVCALNSLDGGPEYTTFPPSSATREKVIRK